MWNISNAPVAVTTKKPDVTTKPTTTTTPIDEPTENKPAASKPADGGTTVTLYGDANFDGDVTMADAASIYQALGNSDKYKL